MFLRRFCASMGEPSARFRAIIALGLAVFVLWGMGVGASYGMGDIRKVLGSSSSSKKTAIIRGVVNAGSDNYNGLTQRSAPAGSNTAGDGFIRPVISGARVELFSVSSSLVFSTPANSQGLYEIKLKLSSGNYKLRCSADGFKQGTISRYIEAGRTYNTGFDFYLERIDSIGPVISIEPVKSPTNRDVLLKYTVSDNVTPANEIQVTGNQSPYTKEGAYNVTLIARDKAGNSSRAQVSWTIDKTAPLIEISSPRDGETMRDTAIQLQGKVDGAGFCDLLPLVPGENTLTKTSIDSAGNSSSASIKVYLYAGELIGPEGGEITSADGRVKVIIPQGALTRSERIRISKLALNNQSRLVGGIGMKILNVVECQPYGLVFNKPVELICSLEQAEIPGTAVELGLYDRIQDKIIPTGQTTAVPVDGYTVQFTLQHFSTYACLEWTSRQGAAIGTGVQIPLPDGLTGSFSHTIPLTIPPGRKGMQPSLGLNYCSSNPNSWVGLGFSLNPGCIIRSTRLGPPAYDDKQDTFYFITEAGTTELVNLTDNLYQAKVESGFTKFFKEPDDTWRVLSKDGAVLRFGQTADSKEGSNSGTFSWYLTKAVDTNGNYIQYHYTKDQGKACLSSIDYTGNETGVSPTNSVQFSLEPRQDISSSYISTSKIATARRLKEIAAKVKGELVWRYELEYEYSADTNRSRLKSVKQSGRDGKILPGQRFGYQSVE